ncbi:hypothetical protein Tco_1275825 [Tanacetum coccineum]
MAPFRSHFLEDLGYLVGTMSRINNVVERILRVKFVVVLFEYPTADRSLLDITSCKIADKRGVLFKCDMARISGLITAKVNLLTNMRNPEEDPENGEEKEEEMEADEQWDGPEWILPYQGADPHYPPPPASESESEAEAESEA